jgi:HrpA-like RNA helicase
LQYNVIFLDEAHERSLPTDIVMSIVKTAYLKRRRRQQPPTTSYDDKVPRQVYPPLYVVVMSATLQIDTFIQYFGGIDKVNLIDIPGRQFPVQILYTAVPQEDYLESTLATILQIHDSDNATTAVTKTSKTNTNGDILVFLPGQEEIENMVLLLKQQLTSRDRTTARMSDRKNVWTGDRVEVIHNSNNKNSNSSSHDVVIVAGVMICVLYAALPPEAQLNAFLEKPTGCIRKVILATNIAETSITIPSIKYVIDTGKYKCRYMMSNSNTGMECLSISDISQAQAAQRSGRAGRVESGICFRLYTEAAYNQLDETSTPEILRVNLSQVILQLKGMGIRDPTTFDFVTPPNSQSIVRAMKVLYALSALDNDMNITEYGKKLSKLPLDPMYGHLLLQSVEYTCLKDMLTTVAVLSVENLLYRPSSNSAESDGNHSITNNSIASKATAAHKRFISHEGDIPTYLNVYNAWRAEAIYVPPSSGGRKAQKKLLQRQHPIADLGKNNVGNHKMQLHVEWCQQNFVSGRALARAFSVRLQLQNLCERSTVQNGLGFDVNTSYGQDRERFLKCIASGLFLQAASRIPTDNLIDDQSKGRSGQIISSRGRYRTKVGNVNVSVHPTSSMFNRQPAPKCVVYTELVVTKKSYIRGVTQIREEWLTDVAPNFYRS